MATIHRKSKNGVWYISYRQGGILKHRSLGTKSGAEARRLKREIELKAESKPAVEFVVVERPIRANLTKCATEFSYRRFQTLALTFSFSSAILESITDSIPIAKAPRQAGGWVYGSQKFAEYVLYISPPEINAVFGFIFRGEL